MKRLRTWLRPYYLQFRQGATRMSFPLIWVWAGAMLLGLSVISYKQSKGEPFRYGRDDMQPNEELSMKMMRWIHKLGLDQVSERLDQFYH